MTRNEVYIMKAKPFLIGLATGIIGGTAAVCSQLHNQASSYVQL
ncbi:hypothetical protein Bsph_0400 [Lysinibacillus sphaericus C3-41]|uniref:Uncharacterized protein n=1 Tax=Lysinibacillus sphaericus (strain C3-41) TaxID=444177 RepID=B1HVK8_LYSSC|nr:hypothetical protein [Lysinibacillus sphaericus]ACA38027.1 hypothetical protein Bsph_0400 [Lysinibacillus sphaericus C3-41]